MLFTAPVELFILDEWIRANTIKQNYSMNPSLLQTVHLSIMRFASVVVVVVGCKTSTLTLRTGKIHPPTHSSEENSGCSNYDNINK